MEGKFNLEYMLEDLRYIQKMTAILLNLPDDLSEEMLPMVKDARNSMSGIMDQCLRNQKKHGKEFISDSEIDDIVDRAIKQGSLPVPQSWPGRHFLPVRPESDAEAIYQSIIEDLFHQSDEEAKKIKDQYLCAYPFLDTTYVETL